MKEQMKEWTINIRVLIKDLLNYFICLQSMTLNWEKKEWIIPFKNLTF